MTLGLGRRRELLVAGGPESAALLPLLLLFLFGIAMPGAAQVAMPDAREMSGIPRPVTDLPDRTISIRVIRGDLSNNIPNQPVDLLIDGKAQTVRTGEDGRAQFGPIPPGSNLKAVAVVDGERLESQEFPAPRQGGIRMMLVATDKAREAQAAMEAAAPPVAGQVVLGGETRIVMEWGDEMVRVFYLLDIVNTARAPVTPPTPFMFDVPTGALGTAVMEGSSGKATATGTRIRVQEPFPPGTTHVEVGFALPTPTGDVELEQRFPADIQTVGVLVEKVGDARLSSLQIDQQREMPIAQRTYIAASGGPIAAGEPLVLSLSGLPHHSGVPRVVALVLVAVIAVVGIWASRRPAGPTSDESERKRLTARREKLFQELVRLETDHRSGRVDGRRYASRREQIVAALERIYGALDTDDTSPDPASRTGLAA